MGRFRYFLALSLWLIGVALPFQVIASHGGLHWSSDFYWPRYDNCWVGHLDTEYEGEPTLPIFPNADAALEYATDKFAAWRLGTPCYNAYRAQAGVIEGTQVLSDYGSPFLVPHTVDYTVPTGWYDLTDKWPLYTHYQYWISTYTTAAYYPEYPDSYRAACPYDGNVIIHARRAFWRQDCQGSYSIRLFPVTGTTESSTTIISTEPGQIVALVAQVNDNGSQPVSGVSVRIEAGVIENSGGHKHHDNQRPKGKLNSNGQNPPVITGTTDGVGRFYVTYSAPDASGDYKLAASCSNCTQEGPDQVWVAVKNLFPLPNDSAYELIPNQDTLHPDNHYLTLDAQDRMLQLADLYRQAFPSDPLLQLNDASLERGGLFDIGAISGAPWKPPHPTHRFGTEIDIRANPAVNPATAIPSANFRRFIRLVDEVGATLEPDGAVAYRGQPKQHFHVCLKGGICATGGNR